MGKESGALDRNVIWLTAVYPIPMRESIEDRLTAVRSRLLAVLRDHRSLIRTIENKIKHEMNTEALAQYSEVAAPLLREFIKALADIFKG